MKISAILAGLMLASLTMGAAAEKQHQPKAKPTYSSEKKKRQVKAPTATRSSSAQELHRVEQSGTRVSGGHRTEEAKTRRAAGVKPLKQDSNAPIHFASSGGSGGKGGGGKAANNYKGRLRHKGSHR